MNYLSSVNTAESNLKLMANSGASTTQRVIEKQKERNHLTMRCCFVAFLLFNALTSRNLWKSSPSETILLTILMNLVTIPYLFSRFKKCQKQLDQSEQKVNNIYLRIINFIKIKQKTKNAFINAEVLSQINEKTDLQKLTQLFKGIQDQFDAKPNRKHLKDQIEKIAKLQIPDYIYKSIRREFKQTIQEYLTCQILFKELCEVIK